MLKARPDPPLSAIPQTKYIVPRERHRHITAGQPRDPPTWGQTCSRPVPHLEAQSHPHSPVPRPSHLGTDLLKVRPPHTLVFGPHASSVGLHTSSQKLNSHRPSPSRVPPFVCTRLEAPTPSLPPSKRLRRQTPSPGPPAQNASQRHLGFPSRHRSRY